MFLPKVEPLEIVMGEPPNGPVPLARQQQQQQEEYMRQQQLLQFQQQQQLQQQQNLFAAQQQQNSFAPQQSLQAQPTGFGTNNPFAPSSSPSIPPSNQTQQRRRPSPPKDIRNTFSFPSVPVIVFSCTFSHAK
jgi:epsin